MKRYRIAWKINGVTGYGSWYESDRHLHQHIVLANARCGAGTHWIESELTSASD